MVWASHLALQHLSVHPYGAEINTGLFFSFLRKCHRGEGGKQSDAGAKTLKRLNKYMYKSFRL